MDEKSFHPNPIPIHPRSHPPMKGIAAVDNLTHPSFTDRLTHRHKTPSHRPVQTGRTPTRGVLSACPLTSLRNSHPPTIPHNTQNTHNRQQLTHLLEQQNKTACQSYLLVSPGHSFYKILHELSNNAPTSQQFSLCNKPNFFY